MGSADLLSFREITGRWADATGKAADALATPLLQAFWEAKLAVSGWHGGAPISRSRALTVIALLDDHPGIIVHNDPASAPDQTRVTDDGWVDLRAHIVLPQDPACWTDADVENAARELAGREYSDYAVGREEFLIFFIGEMAVARQDFSLWYLAQNIYPRPPLEVIWPPTSVDTDEGRHATEGGRAVARSESDRDISGGAPIKTEDRCRSWLEQQMRTSGPQKAKAAYRKEASASFHIGFRAFDRAWGTAQANVGRDKGAPWRRPGRKS